MFKKAKRRGTTAVKCIFRVEGESLYVAVTEDCVGCMDCI